MLGAPQIVPMLRQRTVTHRMVLLTRQQPIMEHPTVPPTRQQRMVENLMTAADPMVVDLTVAVNPTSK